jgi:hypothetical protein
MHAIKWLVSMLFLIVMLFLAACSAGEGVDQVTEAGTEQSAGKSDQCQFERSKK